ncbi:hypothetical protein CHH79_00230 [Bacillus siamensis]|uniref:hypothetical protein n=1 Tax=Bacillus TaxID=1386 RepID=UPI000315B092|nr:MULTISPECIES: hypothetical protein [Bacillus]MBD0406448.1 hypothetical protein [Bacillus sp. 1021]MDU0812673.1 hypothetical protein [Bacillus siamensis]MEC3656006.1 hypothetical protein [Bacillus siamensis]MED0773240.1 hypothetical protein [Bacillus siamensis]MED0775754.1 hypothetical protein [Bacillus siamensis]
MAFGITRRELERWKRDVSEGKIAFLTHYWLDDRFPEAKTVTKAGSSDLDKLIRWGSEYGLKPEWIHHKNAFPHFDLLGETQKRILEKEHLTDHIRRFKL